MTNNDKIQEVQPDKKPGCGLLVLKVLLSTWVVGLTAVDVFINWALEQTLFETSVGVPDVRWLNHAVCSGLVLLPCLIAAFTVKNPNAKIFFRLWTLAAVFSLLTIPLKMLPLTYQNETAVLQICILIISITVSMVLQKKNTKESTSDLQKPRFPGLVIILGAILCVPWILWGALGSVLDTILDIMVGALFAWLAMQFIFTNYLEKKQTSDKSIKVSAILLDGFAVMVTLMIMVAALAVNGSQQLLIITVPIAGWLIVIFSVVGANQQQHGRLSAWIILGLACALPLLFFDMDELSAAMLGNRGEVLEWAIKAAWFTFSGILTATILLFPNRKNIKSLSLSRNWNFGVTMLSLVVILIIYLIGGQVGFFGDHTLLILKTQADLSEQKSIQDYATRRQSVYDALVDTAETSQRDLRAQLDRLKLDYTPYYLLNAIEVDGGNLVKIIFRNDPSIDRILDNPQLRPLPKAALIEEGEISNLPDEPLWNLSMIQSDRVVEELGITGSGIIIGQTDSGVDGRHAELKESYRGMDSVDDYNWYDPWNNTPFPTDDGGHGTMTLSLILGKNTGVAPGAKWIGCVNLGRNLGNPASYLDCMQFMLAPFPQDGNPFKDGDPSKGAMIVNNSWGCPNVEGCDAEIYQPTVGALKTAGIFMSVAAGNTGYYGCSTVSDPPAIYADVFTAGSVNKEGNLSEFSSLGPVSVDGSERKKPELVAPGEDVLMAFPGGTYSLASGTSFAAPHVSGGGGINVVCKSAINW